MNGGFTGLAIRATQVLPPRLNESVLTIILNYKIIKTVLVCIYKTMTNPPSNVVPPPSPETSRPRLESAEILRGSNAVEIEHAGQRYLLRVTRENKLILTK